MGFQLLFVTLLFLSLTTTAQAGTQHILGTVVAIDSKHIEVKTSKGALVSVELGKGVRFKDKDDLQSNEPPEAGDRVIIEAIKMKKVLIATVVHYSAAKKVAVETGLP